MATPGELVEVMAEVSGVPAATVVVHDRNLVAAGLRSKGGRGRSAACVTERDAAHLLVALLGSEQVRDSAQTVQRFSGARSLPHISTAQGFKRSGILPLAQLHPQHSFVDGLEALLIAASHDHLPADSILEVAALSPNTVGDLRLAGLPGRMSFHVRYGDDHATEKVSTRRRASASAARGDHEIVKDLEQYRRVSSRTIFRLGQLLSTRDGGR